MPHDRPSDDYRLAGAPHDPDLPRRIRRIADLGVGMRPDPTLDEFAAQLAHKASAPYAMVNFVGQTQYFAGLYAPSNARTGALEAALATSNAPTMDRTMTRDRGYCPHVVADQKAHVLKDVCAYPRFAPNPVVNEFNIRAYMGAPVYDEDGELILGTVCVVSNGPTTWGRPELDLIKSAAAHASELIQRRIR